MNIVNTIVSLLSNSRTNDLIQTFTKKKNDRSVWAIIGYILIGTVIGMMTKHTNRSQVMDSTKDLFQRVQTQTKDKFDSVFEPKINLGTVEFGEELADFDVKSTSEQKNPLQ